MKPLLFILSILLMSSCVNGEEKTYTASTPAGEVVKTFLGIPLSDSVDFIRWKLAFNNNHYKLNCNFGIGKPNTNGFYNGGKKIEFSGELKKVKNFYQLYHAGKILMLAELNENLLHLMHPDKSLLIGNGGWSYTLNNTVPSTRNEININFPATLLKDSMVFQGRTPCKIPGINEPGSLCYKLKWLIVLYADAEKNKETSYKVYGTKWRDSGPRTGTWKIVPGKNGRTIYQLNDENGKGLVYLLSIDDNVVLFTDALGNLLVGDEDFSYTLNRKLPGEK